MKEETSVGYLDESLETINSSLRDQFGIDTETKQPIFRVVWSEDQFEKRQTNHTDEGFELLTPRVALLPKYRQWIKERYVLERLVVVPPQNVEELAGVQISYEPLWIFETQSGVYLPPKLEIAQMVVDTLYASLGKQSMKAKYVDPRIANPDHQKEKLDKLQAEMFGNETLTTDALAYREGVSLSGPKLADSTSPEGDK